MIKNLHLKTMLLLCVMILGIGSAWAETKSYNITFKDTGSDSDSSTKITSIEDIINEGASYVSSITNISNVYNGRSGRGLKLGTSKANGSLTLNLVTTVKPTKITYKARQYGTSETSITVNSQNETQLTSNFDEYTINYDGNTEVSAIAISTPSKRAYITEVSVYYEDGGSQTSDLEDSDFALTGAPVALNFDLYNNANPQVISYTTSSTGAVTVANSEYISAVVGNGTITVTPLKKTSDAQTITVSQAADDNYKAGSASFTVTVDDSTPIPTHTVTFSVNGTTNTQDFEEGAVITFPSDPADIEGKSFVGWTTMAIDGTTNETPNFVTSATMGNADVTYFAVFADADGEEQTNSLEITANTTGVPTSYGTANTFSEYTLGGVKFQIMQMYKSGGKLQWRAAGNNSGTGTMFNDESLGKITSVVLTYNSSDNNKNFTLKVGNSKNPTEGTAIEPTTNELVYTFDCSSTNCGYFVLTNGSGAGYLDKLVINYSSGSVVYSGYCTTVVADTRDEAGINFAEAAVTTELGNNYTGQALANPNEVSPIIWTSSNETVATVENGTVNVLAAGETTITAEFYGNENYKNATVSYTLTITDPNAHDGSAEKPFTVAEAIAYINTLGSSTSADDVYVSGIISQVDSYNDTYKSITYWISDDGSTTGQMEVYSGKGLDGADFSAVTDLVIGDIVTVKGKVKMYNTTPEFDKNNQLVSITHSTVTSITVNPTTVSLSANDTEGEFTYTINNPIEGTTLTAISDAEWISNITVGTDKVTFNTTANEGAERTATITLKYGTLTQNVTVTQAKYVAPDMPVDPAIAGVGAFVKVTDAADITSGNYLIVYETNNVAFNGSLQTLDAVGNTIDVIIIDNKIASTNATVASTFTIQPNSGTIQSKSGNYIGVSSNSNGLKQSESTEAYTHKFDIDDSGNATIHAYFSGSNMNLRFNKASNQDRFRYYSNGQEPIQLYKYVATETAFAPVKVTAAGYATYCFEKDIDFSGTGLTAYKATINDKSEVSFTGVNQVPAGQGVLLKGEPNTYKIPVIASAAAITDNAFIGVIEETPNVDAGIFVLLYGEQGVGFYKTQNAFTVGAHTAYIPALTPTQGEARNFIAIDEATAIKAIENKQQSGEIYNLAGQRVKSAQKGLYIIGGKKVVIK